MHKLFANLMTILKIFIFLVIASYNLESISQDSRSSIIEKLLSDLYQKHLFNGAIVVGEKGKIIFSKGYGYSDIMNSVLFTPNTPSDGGSNAKTFTATSILLLAEEGKLKLNDPVQRYLPNYPYPNTTVWNLITHSVGGLPDYDYFFEQAADTAIVSTSLNLELLKKNKPALNYPPGTNFYYDNVGFDLAALVVEKVSGKSYYEFLKERIFVPLKMDSSFVRPARFSNWQTNRTIGYKFENNSWQLNDIADREGFYGGCNIWFTAADLYRWGESFYNHPILGKALSEKISSTVFINGKASHVRFGAWYEGKTKTAFYYWGNVAGFYSWVYWDKEKQFTIAFMTNTTMPQWTRPLLTSALINIMSKESFSPIVEPKADSLDRKNLSEIAGNYEIKGIGKAKISVQGTKANLKVNNGMEYRMHLVDKKTFYVPGYDPWISFYSLKNGKFQNINWRSTTLQTRGKRILN
jgi:CubicO group peptidase (beta-lactamase class C family)